MELEPTNNIGDHRVSTASITVLVVAACLLGCTMGCCTVPAPTAAELQVEQDYQAAQALHAQELAEGAAAHQEQIGRDAMAKPQQRPATLPIPGPAEIPAYDRINRPYDKIRIDGQDYRGRMEGDTYTMEHRP